MLLLSRPAHSLRRRTGAGLVLGLLACPPSASLATCGLLGVRGGRRASLAGFRGMQASRTHTLGMGQAGDARARGGLVSLLGPAPTSSLRGATVKGVGWWGVGLRGGSRAFSSSPLKATGGMSVATALLTSAGVIGAMNLAGFAATVLFQTHKLTDLIGTSAFVASALVTARRGGGLIGIRSILANVGVGLWGSRLAGFLFMRILNTGEDKRLSGFFPKEGEGWLDSKGAFFPVYLAGFWTIQALWAWIVSLPVTLLNASPLKHRPMGIVGWVAAAAFFTGFVVESVADGQKYVFKQQPGNADQFINTGLWHYSRHPNYWGEMVVWWSLTALASGGLSPAHAALGTVGPAFLSFLLLKVSGVPLLEAKYDRVYANNPAYQHYKQTTNLLLPWPPTDKPGEKK